MLDFMESARCCYASLFHHGVINSCLTEFVGPSRPDRKRVIILAPRNLEAGRGGRKLVLLVGSQDLQGLIVRERE